MSDQSMLETVAGAATALTAPDEAEAAIAVAPGDGPGQAIEAASASGASEEVEPTMTSAAPAEGAQPVEAPAMTQPAPADRAAPVENQVKGENGEGVGRPVEAAPIAPTETACRAEKRALLLPVHINFRRGE